MPPNLLGPTPGATSIAEEDNSSVCYLQWHRAGKVTKVELLTTEDANLEDVSQFATYFSNAPVERQRPHRTQLSYQHLSELAEVKVASRFRNALYTGHKLGPRYHFAAQCSAARGDSQFNFALPRSSINSIGTSKRQVNLI